jgi:16S rRNA processing protein RimM
MKRLIAGLTGPGQCAAVDAAAGFADFRDMTKPEQLILVGRVQGAFGVKGELRLRAYGDDPLALLAYRDLARQDGSPGLTLVSGRAAKDGLIARAQGIETKEAADALRGLELYAPRSVLPEPDADEFYISDLIGLAVQAPDGTPLGQVKAAPTFGAGDLLEIEPAGGGPTWLVAFTKENVPEVNLAEGRVVIDRPAETE